MTAPILRWYEGAVLIGAPEDLAQATPGTPSTAGVFDLWNDKLLVGADTATDYVLELAVRTPLTSAEILAATPPRPWVKAGHEVVDDYWFEIQQVSGLGTLTLSQDAYRPLGTGRWIDVPTLASGQGVRYNLRCNVPSGAQSTSVEWTLSHSNRRSHPLPLGLYEAIGPGVNLGIGDSEATWLLHVAGNVVENPGGVDQQVRIDDLIGVAAGVPYTILRQLVTISNLDSASAALAAGERYKSLLYVNSSGTLAQEKSVKTSGTPTDPTVPAGGVAIARAVREFDALVNNADITQLYVVGGGHFSSTGFTGSIGPISAGLDNRKTSKITATTVTLTASVTNRIWLLPDSALSVTTTATLPESRAMLLWEAVTDGSGVTSSTDRRSFFAFGYRIQRLDFLFDATLAATQKQRLAYSNNRPGYILPLGGVALYLLTSGATSGATTVDVNLRAPGGAFTTIFTSQGTEDRRPSIAFGATVLQDTDPKPEVLAVPAYSLLEVEIDAIPGASVPVWANVTILIACP